MAVDETINLVPVPGSGCDERLFAPQTAALGMWAVRS